LPPTRDHKKASDGDLGQTPAAWGILHRCFDVTELRTVIEETIVEPTLQGLAADGIRYQGFLFIGLMLTKDGQAFWNSIAG